MSSFKLDEGQFVSVVTHTELPVFLPHRAPMVWMDEVIRIGRVDGNFFGSCRTKVADSQLFCEGRSIRGSAAVELCAQAYGFVKACYHLVHDIDDTPKVAYLTGVKSSEADFSGLLTSDDEFLKVDVRAVRRMENLTFIDGQVVGESSQTIYATVTLQVYTA